MLYALLGPSLHSSKPAKIHTDEAYLLAGSIYLVAQAAKYFLHHVNVQTYSQWALDCCDIGGEILSGAELINDAQSLVAGAKWAKEVGINPRASDFTAKRIQALSKVIFNCMEIFYNTITVGFLLKRLHVVSFSSVLHKRLEKINQVFYLFTQIFSLFKEVYQGYLCNSLSRSACSGPKEELHRKYELSLLSIAETSTKLFLAVFKKVFQQLEGPILALNSCIFVLKISSHLYDNQSSHKGKWKFLSEESGFVYVNET